MADRLAAAGWRDGLHATTMASCPGRAGPVERAGRSSTRRRAGTFGLGAAPHRAARVAP